MTQAKNPQDPEQPQPTSEQSASADVPLPTVTGDTGRPSGQARSTVGRDGDVLVQDDVVLGRSESGVRSIEPSPSADPNSPENQDAKRDRDDRTR